MAYFQGHTPAHGPAFWNNPLKVTLAGVVLLPAIPLLVWCGAWAFRTIAAWGQGPGL